jgi:hypothetical protein
MITVLVILSSTGQPDADLTSHAGTGGIHQGLQLFFPSAPTPAENRGMPVRFAD